METVTFTASCTHGNFEVQGTKTRFGLVRHLALTGLGERHASYTISDPITGMAVCFGSDEDEVEKALQWKVEQKGGESAFLAALEDARARGNKEKELIATAVDALSQITDEVRRDYAFDAVKNAVLLLNKRGNSMPWIPHAPTEPALIAVAVQDIDLTAVDLLLADIERAKPATDTRRPEDIVFAIGLAALARYSVDEMTEIFKG